MRIFSRFNAAFNLMGLWFNAKPSATASVLLRSGLNKYSKPARISAKLEANQNANWLLMVNI
ncbi:hypothetical protein D3C71_1734940 [compost metagenome]